MTDVDDTQTRQGIGPGSVVDGRYRVVERLGEGGVGSVFVVEHERMAKRMAMKILRPELSAITEVQERFEREARSASRLDDPRIVRATDFGRDAGGQLYFVMELVDGKPLSEALRASIPKDEVLDVIDDLLGAVGHAHDCDVIHRDLKPDNVMVVAPGGPVRVKVLDFGLAKITETGADQTLTQAGAVFGTPRYMSPEQAAAEPADHRADLYAVGVILYEALAGRPPFTGASAIDVLRSHITQPPPAIDDLPAPLSAVVERALAKRPGERFQSAAAFAEALRAARDTKAVAPAPKTKSMRAPAPREQSHAVEPKQRHPLLLAGIALFGVLVAAMLMMGGGPETVEAALDRGDIAEARKAADRLAAEHPNDPTTYLALGHVALAEKAPNQARDAFAKALDLDQEIASEIRFATTMMKLVETDTPPSSDVVKDIAATGGLGSVPFLAEVFAKSPSASVRRRAYAGLERLESAAQAPKRIATLIDDLAKVPTRSCEVRRWYVRRLLDIEDPKVDEAIERERNRSGALPFIPVNGCMEKELRAGVKKE
ncbi:MAG: protein kinase [Deltaproteobacteria bacterium]|jgi:tRNA A-37 threonylcarbamoyl transferase component Bud32/tetratricopeptide (TPR) repeat protein